MSLVDIEFLYFLPVVFLLHWLLPRRASIQNVLLLAASYLFYASWHPYVLGLLVLGTLVDYRLGALLAARGSDSIRRVALAASLTLSLGCLAAFKYHGFFAEAADAMMASLGVPSSLRTLQVLLPLGMSFYTLQRVGYVLDVYWRRSPPTGSLLAFANFCAFFPQLTAGPIARAAELLTQFERPRHLHPDTLYRSAGLLVAGYALKVFVATALGPKLVDPVFDAPTEFTVAAHWVGVIAYALQVFADFGGYSLMAIGIAGLFGLSLPRNFDLPFLSRSLPELWRRWHISLNRWLFDYVFTPLTTSTRWCRGRIKLALLVTFFVSGVWHGATWGFVAWGLLHGLGMAAHQVWDERYRAWCRTDRRFVAWRRSAWYAAIAWLLTMGFFVATMVPFRASDGMTALTYAKGLLVSDGTRGVDYGVTQIIVVLALVAWHVLGTGWGATVRSRIAAAPPLVWGGVLGLAIAMLIVLTPIGPGTFIYQQF